MNLFTDIHAVVLAALGQMQAEGALPEGLDFANVTVEPPRDPLHGDMATNAAMVLAKAAKSKPRDIAEKLVEKLAADDRITSAEVAGPGFINLRLAPAVWQGLVSAVLNSGTRFGRSEVGAGKKVNVEYVSANPTGPLHVGHTRGAVFGDALASLLDFAGYDVTREYYINDGGSITLTSGVLSREPMRGSVVVSMVNGALESFVKAAALEVDAFRINVVSPIFVKETMAMMGMEAIRSEA